MRRPPACDTLDGNLMDLLLARGRQAFQQQAWANAYAQLSAAAQESSLEVDDLERLAVAAYLVGRESDSADFWTRAHHACLRLGDPARAARCAFWLGLGLLLQGEMARGSGWLARARRLVDDGQLNCVEQGYLLVPVALQSMEEGDPVTAEATFAQVAQLAERF